MPCPNLQADFRLVKSRFTGRVRDRDPFLLDEARGIVMRRAFIAHKSVLDHFQLTDGTPWRSIFREPHSWSLLEMFKIKGGLITAIEATFIAAPYYARSPWAQPGR